ncbi:hypothetical protein PHET_12133 [Paragonimus heterotremus]|uniref:Uncharacterized protein n=1 Tax=Paragonimus heterotremus TaxID=100268 RepID=A0A8J4SKP4_9TREM|nr:hypothetical protein PHET_12133 [Paragonimus heterotremus]
MTRCSSFCARRHSLLFSRSTCHRPVQSFKQSANEAARQSNNWLLKNRRRDLSYRSRKQNFVIDMASTCNPQLLKAETMSSDKGSSVTIQKLLRRSSTYVLFHLFHTT